MSYSSFSTNSVNFQSLLQTHDVAGDIIYRKLKNPEAGRNSKTAEDGKNGTTTMPVGETIKMVGIKKKPNEPLGLTVELDEFDQLKVARIISGGSIDRQGLLHSGDVILEVNGVKVHTPEELQVEISRAKDSVTLKIGPNLDEEIKSARLMNSGGAQVNNKSLEAGKKLVVSNAFFLLFLEILTCSLCFVGFGCLLCIICHTVDIFGPF